MVIQALFLVAIVRFGNHSFFSIYPPKQCLLILGQLDEQEQITDKLNHFRLQWRVRKAVTWDYPELRNEIEASEVVFITDVPQHEAMRILQICYDLHRDVLCKAKLQDIMLSSAQQVVIDDAPFLEMDYHKMTLWQRIVKRFTDIFLSALILLLLSPLMAIIALLIHYEDGGKVIFRQSRMTIGGRNFTIYKFRTMKEHFEGLPQSSATENDPRITRVGRVLRRTRLDELPQFWNVLIGNMSLVGTRPPTVDEWEKYAYHHRARLSFKPGITGMWQVSGRSKITDFEEVVRLDTEYIEHWDLGLDLRILLKTVTAVLHRDGAM
jgi:exopolysaccharide biosynthesis polyprenyl glycosylphosphotransferase